MKFYISSTKDEAKDLINLSIERLAKLFNPTEYPDFTINITDFKSYLIKPKSNSERMTTALFVSAFLPKQFGFSYVKTNDFTNKKTACVILNLDLIREFGLSDCEFDAILAHEFGTFLNVPPDKPERVNVFVKNDKGDFVTNPDKHAVQKSNINSHNYSRNKTIYADYFVKSIGLKSFMLSVIEKKYPNSIKSEQSVAKERKDALESDKDYIGSVIEL
jgi:hypothetical protein